MTSMKIEMSDEARARFQKVHDKINQKLAETLGGGEMKVTPETIKTLQKKVKAIIDEHRDISLADDERFYPYKIIDAEVNEQDMSLNMTIELREPLVEIKIPKEELEKWKPRMEKLLKELDDNLGDI